MTLRVRRDEDALMVERHQAVSNRDVDGFTVEPHPDRIQHRSETDLAGPPNPARRRRLHRRFDRHRRLGGGESESFPRHNITNALMAAIVVVFMHPTIELGLGFADR